MTSICEDALDANDDGMVNLTDVIYMIEFEFLGGVEPPDPFPAPDADMTTDELECFVLP